MKKLQFFFQTCLIFASLLLSQATQSAEFCVTTSAELQNALNSAAGNSQNDVIKIAEGSYITPAAEFSFFGVDSWDLEISGGWTEFVGNPCGQQLSANAYLTTLDGDQANRVLRIRAFGTADIKISNLLLANGLVSSPFRGGGLYVYSQLNDHMGDITVEQVAFINNKAANGGALSMSGGNKIVVRNSLFAASHSDFSANVSIVQNDRFGVYFTNNTVYLNTNDDDAPAGFRIALSGTSQSLIANNLLWNNDNHDLNLAGGGTIYLHNNNFGSRFGSNPAEDLNNTSLPPRFDSGILNFTPSAVSPLVNAGRKPCNICPIPTPFDELWGLGFNDLEGNQRVQLNTVDIGAFESPYQRDLIFMSLFD